MTLELLTCPCCGIPGFTKRGLGAHYCSAFTPHRRLTKEELEMPRKPKPETPEAPPRDSAPSAVEAPSAHEDLGYTAEEWRDFTPDQRRAFRAAFDRLAKLRATLRDAHADAAEKAKEAKEAKDAEAAISKEVDGVFEELEEIASGAGMQKLPGMGAGQPAAGEASVGDQGQKRDEALSPTNVDLGPIPEEMYSRAIEHVFSAKHKGKGLDANSLSLALFSSRKKEHKPRCEQILAQLAAEYYIVPDESDDGKARWLPDVKTAGKE